MFGDYFGLIWHIKTTFHEAASAENTGLTPRRERREESQTKPVESSSTKNPTTEHLNLMSRKWMHLNPDCFHCGWRLYLSVFWFVGFHAASRLTSSRRLSLSRVLRRSVAVRGAECFRRLHRGFVNPLRGGAETRRSNSCCRRQVTLKKIPFQQQGQSDRVWEAVDSGFQIQMVEAQPAGFGKCNCWGFFASCFFLQIISASLSLSLPPPSLFLSLSLSPSLCLSLFLSSILSAQSITILFKYEWQDWNQYLPESYKLQ